MRSVPLALAVLLAACASEGPPDSEGPSVGGAQGGLEAPDTAGAAAPENERPAVSVRPGVRLDGLLAPAEGAEALLGRLRDPRDLRLEPVANRHVEGQTDTVRTYVYDGLELEVYDVTDGPAFVQRLSVTGGEYGTADGVSVGESRTDLEAALGAPVEEEGASVWYEVGGGPAPTPVEVVYEPDAGGVERATQITWRPYVD